MSRLTPRGLRTSVDRGRAQARDAGALARAAVIAPEDLGESRVLPALAVLTAASLYATLPGKFIGGSGALLTTLRFSVPILALVLVAPLALTAPQRRIVYSVGRRTAAIALIAVISAANAAAIVLLVHEIVNGHKINGHALVRASIHIWCTNVIVFSLWFWQLDSGGPMARFHAEAVECPDFLFPQQAVPDVGPANWRPKFLDYLYLSFTNSTAFSPTDTMPLTQWAKMLMLVESGASMLTLVMVAARAVNILQ